MSYWDVDARRRRVFVIQGENWDINKLDREKFSKIIITVDPTLHLKFNLCSKLIWW
jgi:hypothetical protein